MDKTVESILDNLIAVEGGYVEDPRDAGGATCWRITAAVAKQPATPARCSIC